MKKHIPLFMLLIGIGWSVKAQIVINELMIDPSPVVSLPNCEWMELYNTSNNAVNLAQWIIKGGSCDCVLPSFSLAAHSYVIVAATASKGKLDSYGSVLYCNCFPSLNNEGKALWLLNPLGKMQDFVSYSVSWYGSDSKSQGGWTLERKDASLSCNCSDNWTASTDETGGTPGRANAVCQTVAMAKATIDAVGNISDSSITIHFSTAMDSASLFTAGNYSFDHGFGNPVGLYSNFPYYDAITLVAPSVLEKGESYAIRCSNGIVNCAHQAIDAISKQFAFAESPLTNDIIINEILFNPPSDGVDFVELYNRSSKVLDLKDISLANRNSTTNALGTQTVLNPQGQLIFPGDYIVLTANAKLLHAHYSIPPEAIVIELSSFPSFPDNEGTVCLLNKQGRMIDEFHYLSSMHSEALASVQGVSLERIDPNSATNEVSNWHSAAWSCGFATPGYQNSQFMNAAIGEQLVTISPHTFSPDNDGVDDVAAFTFHLPGDGFTASIYIFNVSGILVRRLINNKTLATSGSLFWDGTNDDGMLVPIGIYIIYCSAFDEKGTKKQCKITCTVVSK